MMFVHDKQPPRYAGRRFDAVADTREETFARLGRRDCRDVCAGELQRAAYGANECQCAAAG